MPQPRSNNAKDGRGQIDPRDVANSAVPMNGASQAEAGLITGDGSAALHGPRVALGANDGPVDDFLDLVDNWEEISGHTLVSTPVLSAAEQAIVEEAVPSAQAEDAAGAHQLLGQIAQDFSPRQMRQLGESLLRLADAIDQAWDPRDVKSSYHWITRAGQIERHALQLAQVAIRLRQAAKRRTAHLAGEFLGEPAWEMLLELFIQFAGGAQVSTKSLCIASGSSDTTALRIIDRLEDAGLLERSQSTVDKRVTLIGLTRKGVLAVGTILRETER